MENVSRYAKDVSFSKTTHLCHYLRKGKVHNMFCRDPDTGKPHVRIYEKERPERGVSTHQGQSQLWYGNY